MKEDPALRQLIAGVINRQTRCILKDPYANAFYKDDEPESQWKSDLTEMKPGVHERKWEIDSLCFPIRLAYRYWKTSRRRRAAGRRLAGGDRQTLQTFREQQRKTGRGPYRFQRRTTTPTDSLPGSGYGRPVKPVGLICSMFRPSDDSTVFPVPRAVELLRRGQPAAGRRDAGSGPPRPATRPPNAGHWPTKSKRPCGSTRSCSTAFGKIYAYEVDGYGNSYCIDDSNVPEPAFAPLFRRSRGRGPDLSDHAADAVVGRQPLLFQGTEPPKARAGRTPART